MPAGLPVRLLLTPGQASDKATAPDLLEGLPPAHDVIADRGYDWQFLIDFIAARGGRAHIPTQRDRKVQRSVDPKLYKTRNLVERFFNKLKHFRRIATRFDKWPGTTSPPYFSPQLGSVSGLMSPRPRPAPTVRPALSSWQHRQLVRGLRLKPVIPSGPTPIGPDRRPSDSNPSRARGRMTEVRQPVASRGQILVMAVVAGITVANLYYSQPILAEIASRSASANPRSATFRC